MNIALLDAWSTVDYQFLCRACAFQDHVYDAQSALSRCVTQIHKYVLHLTSILEVGTLPLHVCQSQSVATFRSRLKMHFSSRPTKLPVTNAPWLLLRLWRFIDHLLTDMNHELCNVTSNKCNHNQIAMARWPPVPLFTLANNGYLTSYISSMWH